MPQWATFATVSGAAAASLTGLLFVAVSIRIDVIAGSPELRNRAAQTLSLFVTVLLIAILLAIPDQAAGALGAELVSLALIAGASLFVLERRARRSTPVAGTEAITRILESVSPNTVTSVVLLIAGLLVAFGVHAGLDILVVPVIAALAGGVASAWLLLTKLAE